MYKCNACQSIVGYLPNDFSYCEFCGEYAQKPDFKWTKVSNEVGHVSSINPIINLHEYERKHNRKMNSYLFREHSCSSYNEEERLIAYRNTIENFFEFIENLTEEELTLFLSRIDLSKRYIICLIDDLYFSRVSLLHLVILYNENKTFDLQIPMMATHKNFKMWTLVSRELEDRLKIQHQQLTDRIEEQEIRERLTSWGWI